MSQALDGPRLVINSNNKAALVVITTLVGISWTALALVIRVVSKLHVKKTVGLEEILVVIASIFAFCTSSCMLVGVKHGFGKRTESLQPNDINEALKALWATDLFYVITLAVAKGAVLPLLTQLTPIRKFVIACYMLAVFIGCWAFASIFIVEARCNIDTPWLDTSSATCPSLLGRWAAVETVGLLIEVLIFALFASIIAILKMKLSAKLKVLAAFSIRLTVIIPVVYRLYYLQKGLQASEDTLFALTDTYVSAQAVLHYTTIAASFAYIKPFLRSFDSNLGATVKVDTVVSTGYLNSSGSHSAEREGKPHRPRPQPLSGVLNKEASYKDIKSQTQAPDRSYLRPVSIVSHRSKTPEPSGSQRSRLFGHLGGNSGEDKPSHKSQDSVESMAPIFKTTEWTVQREGDFHAI